jgi:hypothetical protein
MDAMPRARSLLRTALILALAGGLMSESSCRAKSNPDGEKPPPDRGGSSLAPRVVPLPAPPPLPGHLVLVRPTG